MISTVNPKPHPLKCFRFADLVDLGIVKNRVTLRRWIEAGHFPAPMRLGGNSIAWLASEVQGFLDARASERHEFAARLEAK